MKLELIKDVNNLTYEEFYNKDKYDYCKKHIDIIKAEYL